MRNSKKNSLKDAAKKIFTEADNRQHYMKMMLPKLVEARITDQSIDALRTFKEGEPLYILAKFNDKLDLMASNQLLDDRDLHWQLDLQKLLIAICCEKYVVDEVETKMFDKMEVLLKKNGTKVA